MACLVPYQEPMTMRVPKPAMVTAWFKACGLPDNSYTRSAAPATESAFSISARSDAHAALSGSSECWAPMSSEARLRMAWRSRVISLSKGNCASKAVVSRPTMPCPKTIARSPISGRPSIMKLTAVSVLGKKRASIMSKPSGIGMISLSGFT